MFFKSTAVSVVLLALAVLKIHKDTGLSRKTFEKPGCGGVSGARKRVNISKVALKLVLLVGGIELIGLIQIPARTTTGGETTPLQAVNATFRLMYTLLRCLKGLFIFAMYMDADTMLLRKPAAKKKLVLVTNSTISVVRSESNRESTH